MASGSDTLRSMDRSLAHVRDEFRKLDHSLQTVTVELGQERRREAELYAEMARLRLDHIASDEFRAHMDAADKRAGDLLSARASRLADLTIELDGFQGDIDKATADGHTIADELAAQATQRDELIARVDAALATCEDYVEQSELGQRLVDQAARAEEKTANSEESRRRKGEPYEADALFQYLWERGYGTSTYRAWPLARFFDAGMARHIGYEQARRNYHMLNEIPKRLRAHTEALEQKAQQSIADLAGMERRAEVDAGIEDIEAKIAAIEIRQADADSTLSALEASYQAALEEREQFANGTDRFFVEAMQVLVQNFRVEPVSVMRREAEITTDYVDDSIVAQLADVRQDVKRLNQQLNDQQQVHGDRLARLNELTQVRQRYKQHRYDSVESVIDDRGNVEIMLSEFLRGTISSDRLWRVIRHSQRFRRRMRSSTGRAGTIRMPRVPRSIRLPGGFGGGGGFKAPRMPRGGGFRTKGGF